MWMTSHFSTTFFTIINVYAVLRGLAVESATLHVVLCANRVSGIHGRYNIVQRGLSSDKNTALCHGTHNSHHNG